MKILNDPVPFTPLFTSGRGTISSMNRRFLGYVLFSLGVLILAGTVVSWFFLRGQDFIAISQLATPDTSTIPLAPPTIPVNPERAIITAVPGDLPQIIPTLAYDDLPSVARADEAPRVLRQEAPDHPQRMVIPAIGVDAPIRDVGLSSIFDNDDIFYQWQVPHSYAVGWHHTSVPLGQPGNTVFNGHHNVYGEVFKDLQDLAVGDGLLIYTDDNVFAYEVTQREILAERGQSEEIRRQNAIWIQPTLDERITLVSCWPYSDNSHRLVVVAEPIQTSDNRPQTTE